MDCGSDTLGSNPARFILEFCFLNNWIDLDSHEHFTEQNIQETEISYKKSEMCCESYREEIVILEYANEY